MYPVTPWNKGFRFGQLYPAGLGSLTGKPHLGLDIKVPVMTPIIAHCSGFVTTTTGEQGGNIVILKTKGLTYWYFHCSRFGFTGQVKKGDVIGYTGGEPGKPGAGTSTAPHVHIGSSNTGKIETTMSKLLDPEKLFYDPIKVTVLCEKNHNFDLVVDEFAAYGIHIEVTDRIQFTELEWKGGLVNIPKIMFDYGSHANGCDIFVVMTSDWHSQVQGYMDSTKVGLKENLFGFEYIFIDENGEVFNQNETFKYEDPRLRSFAHELFHAFFKMAGKQDDLGNGNWKVHELNDRGALLKEHGIDISNIYTRNKDTRYRLYKRTNTEVTERIVTKEQAGMFKSGLLYWRLFGFKPNL